MQTVWLIRHGETVANKNWLYCGRSDLPLTEEGEEALRQLRRQGGYPDASALRKITSGMRRTEKTAELLFGGDGWERIPALREIDFGDFELQSYESLKDQPAYQRWLEGDNEKNRCPNGESGEDMKKRVLEAWRQIVADGRDTVAVTHGGPIAAILEEIFPDSGRSRYDLQPKPGHGWRIRLENGVPLCLEAVPPQREEAPAEEERFLSARWAWTAGGMLAGFVVAILAAAVCGAGGHASAAVAFACLAVLLLAGCTAVRVFRLRCPYCGKGVAPLNAGGSKMFCPVCGKPFRFEKR